MAFDPTLPVNNSLISAVELRNQLNGVNDNIVANSAANIGALDDLSFSVSDPPQASEVQDILDKLNQLIAALKRP